ncbi:MAG: hypothetical protein ACI867_000322 [Glaciecola sp.]|jgi:hypothetical protein
MVLAGLVSTAAAPAGGAPAQAAGAHDLVVRDQALAESVDLRMQNARRMTSRLARTMQGPAAQKMADEVFVGDAGDLDGDGFKELLVDDSSGTRIASGKDGTVLLDIPFDVTSPVIQPLNVDIDADGRDDLVTLSIEAFVSTTSPTCAIAVDCTTSSTWNWVVTWQSGLAGNPTALATLPASAVITLTSVVGPLGSYVDVDADLLDAELTVWASKGSAPQFVLEHGRLRYQENNWEVAVPAAMDRYAAEVRVDSSLVVDVVTPKGKLAWSNELPYDEGYATAFSGGDMDGDAREDLMTVRRRGESWSLACFFMAGSGSCESGQEDGGTDLSAWMLADGVTAWEQSAAGYTLAQPLNADVDADGADDLFVRGRDQAGSVISGRDGTKLFSPPSMGMFGSVFLGAGDGFAWFGGLDDKWSVMKIDGVTGAVLGTTSHELPEFDSSSAGFTSTSLELHFVDDDKIADVVLERQDYDENYDVAAGQFTVMTSLDGQVRFLTDAYELGWSIYVDLTGDGLLDVYSYEPKSAQVEFFDLATQRPLWSTKERVLGAVDVDHDGAAELLLDADDQTLALFTGATGTTRWSLAPR